MSDKKNNSSSILGIALVASGAIGAGMFSLPMIASGMWFSWAIIGLFCVWAANLAATLLLVETNLEFKTGASFNTIVQQRLGPRWAAINNLSVAFILYILLYAYFSASGSILQQSFQSIEQSGTSQLPARSVFALLFGALIAVAVWSGSKSVSRMCTVLLLAMVITFFSASSGMLILAEVGNLFPKDTGSFGFFWVAIPYFVTAFACAGMVPSIVKLYNNDRAKVRTSFIYGTLVTLAIYLIWICAVFGVLSPDDMSAVISSGANMGELVNALQSSNTNLDNANSDTLNSVLSLFSNFAITTSFLGVGLNLFDFLADRFSYTDAPRDRAIIAAMCFVPPALLSALLPNGFVHAIGYAGLAVLFSFYLVPLAMAQKERLQPKKKHNTILLFAILAFTIVAALSKILGLFGLISLYP